MSFSAKNDRPSIETPGSYHLKRHQRIQFIMPFRIAWLTKIVILFHSTLDWSLFFSFEIILNFLFQFFLILLKRFDRLFFWQLLHYIRHKKCCVTHCVIVRGTWKLEKSLRTIFVDIDLLFNDCPGSPVNPYCWLLAPQTAAITQWHHFVQIMQSVIWL